MLSSVSSSVVSLHKKTNVLLLNQHVEVPYDVSLTLSFAAFLSNDSLVYGGVHSNLASSSVFVDSTLLFSRKRFNVVPLCCQVLPSNHEEGEDDIWVLWSDHVLSRTAQKSTLFFQLDATIQWHGLVAFSSHPPPLRFLVENSGGSMGGGGTAQQRRRRCSPWNVVCCGVNHVASFHYVSSNHNQHTLLAVSATMAVTSLLSSFAKRYFSPSAAESNGENDDEEEEEHSILSPMATFRDERREFVKIVRGTNLVATNDSLGRVMVFVPNSLQVLRVLKGYREAEICFLPGLGSEALVVHSHLSRAGRIECWECDFDRLYTKTPRSVLRVSDPVSFVVNGLGDRAVLLHGTSKEISPLSLEGLQRASPVDAYFLPSSTDLPPIDLVKDFTWRDWQLRVKQRSFSLGLDYYGRVFPGNKHLEEIAPFCQMLTKLKQPFLPASLSPHVLVKDLLGLNHTLQSFFPSHQIDQCVLSYLENEFTSDIVILTLFCVSLLGDVFLTRQLVTFLHKAQDDNRVVRLFVHWWISTPVESCTAWQVAGPVSNVSVAKFAQVLLRNVKLDDVKQLLLKEAHGQIQIGRSCLLLHALEEEDASFLVRFERAKAVKTSSGSFADLDSASYLHEWKLKLIMNEFSDETKIVLRQDEADVLLFANAGERDLFRLKIVSHWIAQKRFRHSLHCLQEEMECESWGEEGTVLAYQSCVDLKSDSLFDSNCQALVLLLAKHHPVASAIPRSLATVLAVQYDYPEKFDFSLDLSTVWEPPRVGKLLSFLALKVSEDERLRVWGHNLGLSPDFVCHILTMTFALHGWDERSLACFDRFPSEDSVSKQRCALELLEQVIRIRMQTLLRSNPTVQYDISPKLHSWLAAQAGNGHVANSSVHSTRDMLLRILPALEKGIHSNRCLELITMTEVVLGL